MKMFQRIKRATLIFLAINSLVLPMTSWTYDDVSRPFDEINAAEYVDLSGTYPPILVVGSGIGMYRDLETGKVVRAMGTFAMGGSGTVIYDEATKTHYVITAAHVVCPESVLIQETTNASYHAPIISITERIIHVGSGIGSVSASIVWLSEEQDLCLLKLNGRWVAGSGTRYEIAPTGDRLLEKGDAIAVLVQKRDADGSKLWSYEVRYGKVLELKPTVPPGMEDALPWFSMYDVTTDILLYPGDSGSAVFAFKNGVPIIIGVARAVYDDGFGYYFAYFSRIDQIYWMMQAK